MCSGEFGILAAAQDPPQLWCTANGKGGIKPTMTVFALYIDSHAEIDTYM